MRLERERLILDFGAINHVLNTHNLYHKQSDET